MKLTRPSGQVILDINDDGFLGDLLNLEKHDRHSAMEPLKKLRRMRWNEVYRDQGLKWEKILQVKPPPGVLAVYSLRIAKSRRATVWRDGDFLRFLTIAPTTTAPMAHANLNRGDTRPRL